jgi:protein phosphatase
MRLLICSDGLTKELTSYGIRHFLVANPKPEQAARQLVEAAVGNGGRDNITVVVLDVLKVVRPAHAPLHRHPDSDVD